ncbi:hybrid sensor histidine kinase/response regulator transcription factor [Mangrovibacterium lignilyticum]|uniref:hybrid sensor histidine kinase/response regulator transcription factor n=1 Tax=Mangrovibacterium lignilyticum TaxID=2668052 RepID=UPI0013D6C850|nr:response regulator [Mangrovibacterium lignilyticum]
MKLRIQIQIVSVFFLLIAQLIPLAVSANTQFYNINEEYGVSIRETNSVCSDLNGFIWISSKMGIVRFSQNDIRTYQLPYETEDVITVKLLYEYEELYAYTNNGQIFLYDAIRDRFILLVNIAESLNNPYVSINSILIDSQKRIWAASSFGLYCYDASSGLKSLEQNETIHYLGWYDETHFFYFLDGEVKLFNTIRYTSACYYKLPDKLTCAVSSMWFDKAQNELWLGTLGEGLCLLTGTPDSLQFINFNQIPNQPILAIEPISDAILLLGIDGQGVWEFDKTNRRVVSVYKEDADRPNSLKGNGVYDIYCDPNNRVWVCTYSGGVSFFDQENPIVTKIGHLVNNHNSLINDEVNSVLEDSDGNIWFATNNGISRWDVKANRWASFYYNNEEHAQVFHDLCEDDLGRIWAGTYSSGLYVLDRRTGNELHHYSFEESSGTFNGDFVFDIVKDVQGNIWIGGVRGDLIRYSPTSKRFQSFENFTVNVLANYGEDKLLIGTTFGLQIFDKEKGTTETLVDGYLVYDLYVKDNIIWLCTSGNGVVKYNLETKKAEVITTDTGLPSNYVKSIVYASGYFWIGTEQGLCRLREEDSEVLTFGSNIALSNVSFNQNAHTILSNGKIAWGTNKGAVIFDPKVVVPTKDHGKIFFQDLAISGRSIRDIAAIELNKPLDSLLDISLKYYQNTVSLELIPIGVISPGSKFSWKLDDLDRQWSKPGNNRILSYSNIPSGDYTLRIRMFDSSLTDILAERSVKLNIVPPFWETWLFRISVFVLLAGMGIFLFAFYIGRLKKQHSDEKIRFFANTAHDMRTSLTLIKGPIEELNKEEGLSAKALQYLHIATEQSRRLSKVVTQLMDFQKVDIGKERLTLTMVDLVKLIGNRIMMFESYAKTKKIELKFKSEFPEFVTAVDEVMIEKVIDNLLSNAIKYSYADVSVHINFQVSGNKWVLDVQDIGMGISKKAQRQLFNEYYRGENAVNAKIVGSGIGLLLVKNYVSLHGGKVSCYSQQSVGSSFSISVPVMKTMDAHEPENKQNDTVPNGHVAAKVVRNTVLMSEMQSLSRNKMKVLIVEDHDSLREFLRSTMEEEFQIELAEDGEQAWEMIQKNTPDLVVSDIMMPRMDGYELCEKLKSNYETSHIPIILLTALSNKSQHLKGLGLGADDYLTKPFDVTLLQQRIKTIIQNRELIRDKALKIIKQTENDEAILDNELNDKFLKRMGEVVRENIANSEFTKDDFAAAMNVSPSLLYKKIKSLTNQSPTDFIKSIRLDHAVDLIQSHNYTVTEVSELCGFSSVGYFSTVFRKHYGKSPTQVV